MTGRKLISSGKPWEAKFGYSRAVRVGPHVEVSSTGATNEDGSTFAPGNMEAQVRKVFEIIETALHEAGATRADVVRNTFYIRDLEKWEIVARVHGELFGDIRPTTSWVFTQGWPAEHPGMEIEIQCSAYVLP